MECIAVTMVVTTELIVHFMAQVIKVEITMEQVVKSLKKTDQIFTNEKQEIQIGIHPEDLARPEEVEEVVDLATENNYGAH